MDCLGSRPPRHETKFVLFNKYDATQTSLQNSLPLYHGMTKELNTFIVPTVLSITFGLIYWDQST